MQTLSWKKREREREGGGGGRGRESEREREGEGKKKELVSSPSMRKEYFVAINLLGE